MSDQNDFHPDDPNGNWDYSSRPDPEEYHKQDGDLERFSDDYDEWEDEQRRNNE